MDTTKENEKGKEIKEEKNLEPENKELKKEIEKLKKEKEKIERINKIYQGRL